VSEFDFRHDNRIALALTKPRATRALKGAKRKRLTYETTRVAEA
jgi:hypothetical protein